MGKAEDERDLRAEQALAIWAEAITDATTRGDFANDKHGTIDKTLKANNRSIDDLPKDVVDFLTGLSAQELQTLANLQATMVGVRGKGFNSLSTRVQVNPPFTLAKL
jgi:hypothetical protein